MERRCSWFSSDVIARKNRYLISVRGLLAIETTTSSHRKRKRHANRATADFQDFQDLWISAAHKK
ncbi:hypothetical protein [Magnetospirillum sulfuroxidans]|uniref:Uncharacterized protein n=1 Tax=Magnetospirillum sulfuroxidans TaxID=611300 RepID=A0ABS5I9R4_9PROT|nr:hypothetical protein [Magnetospirillum sulfuroxidans]MBR9971011.1 hypothetical protein [Magnetospirillum sulfuroxidans]